MLHAPTAQTPVFVSCASRTMAVKGGLFEQQKSIIEMARTDISVQSCIRRLGNWCLCNGIEITEDGAKLKSEFARNLLPHFHEFLRRAIEASFVCGFVPWYIVDDHGMRYPCVLPLGSFTWSSEVASKSLDVPSGGGKRRKLHEVYRYKIDIVHGDVHVSKVHIYNFTPPRIGATCSPMHSLYELYLEVRQYRQMLNNIVSYNSRKHVYFSEKINFNELGSSSGLSLLDEFRRYTVTGKASDRDVKMFTQRGKLLNSVNDAHMHWINNQFDDDIQKHVLPPNMEAHELQSVDVDEFIKNQDLIFQHQVHMFFDLPYSIGARSALEKVHQTEHLLSEEQYTNIRCLCDFLQKLAGTVYSDIFDTENVEVTLRARPRLTLTGADDIKKLFECNVLTQRDAFKLRNMFLNQ